MISSYEEITAGAFDLPSEALRSLHAEEQSLKARGAIFSLEEQQDEALVESGNAALPK